ncbi:bifunctional isochorismate lyase/aryl carrier protein/2,3-dihydroxybenzoate-AMP ligase [Chromobacterium alkanivorans]|uniref:phosphopantetheine-binding protein n=1 Tax=Chromobacterium alkanivorans TaxID=1071719 RepID=UPI00216729AC|nr:phosphopantetheine-binding protein [Chromobacterium alkanivorans]MCS3805691.1 bifunctional isochorismate lyase/aryl carrier protein/2,3-dihydroxybenzoate-AMP ligase [Chromobacterium alkanivorans]MCS3820079.1 bifunctional isochorismate lyase/aryl carrier protein/2,3-dihydroxybenzoate-AMP ligase [Chromobacterium alkanivorans]MCS3874836.1 bifunctional isochorismate lyase/aryl carrier protein/2,3-dihydroxybenzoate-AMP ligase [Chromobacterium alkanivorans]
MTNEKAISTTPPQAASTRQWLHGRLRQLTAEDGALNPTENLMYYGLDSLRLMTLAAELNARGIPVRTEELSRSPTLADWEALLDARQASA